MDVTSPSSANPAHVEDHIVLKTLLKEYPLNIISPNPLQSVILKINIDQLLKSIAVDIEPRSRSMLRIDRDRFFVVSPTAQATRDLFMSCALGQSRELWEQCNNA